MLAHQKRVKTGVKYEKTHSLDHEHILSGILKCPLCGSGMYGNVNRKKKKDGTFYKVPFPGVFWRQGDTGTLLGQRKYR